MKRHWRPGRIILGVLLCAIAVLVYALWPASCWRVPVIDWRMPAEDFIGFDEARGLLYIVQYVSDHHELRGYSLADGSQQKTVELSPLTGKPSLGVQFDEEPGVPKVDPVQKLKSEWKWVLSPNKHVLVGLNQYQDNFQLIDLDSGQLIRQIPYPKENAPHFFGQIGFSDDGVQIGFRDYSDHFYVWDLNSGQLLNDFDNRKDTSQIILISGPDEMSLDQLHLSSRQNYLAFSEDKKSVLRDLKNKTNLVEHPVSSIPKILDDGNLVVFTPRKNDEDNRPVWYRKQADGTWLRLPLDLTNRDVQAKFVCYTPNLLVTQTKIEARTDKLNWLPEAVWSKANQLFHFSGTRRLLQFWDSRSGMLKRKFEWFDTDHSPANGPSAQMARAMESAMENLNVTDTGNYLICSIDHQLLNVWDTTGRRPIVYWLIAGSILSFTLWLAWPRRLKPVQGS